MIKGVVFDLDGTITKPNLDFAAIRREIGIFDGPILEYMETVSEDERRRINEILERHEREAAENSELNGGVRTVMDFLRKQGIKTALLTRNSQNSVKTVMEKHDLTFDFIVSREDAAPKPSPEPIFLISEYLDIPTADLLVIGDYVYDVIAGNNAGTLTALFTNGQEPKFDVPRDYTIKHFSEIIQIICAENGECNG